MPDSRFPPTHRLKAPADFRRVYDRKRSAADGCLVVYACENGLPHPRLGLSVSRAFARASGGDLAVVPRDQGACFALEIPATMIEERETDAAPRSSTMMPNRTRRDSPPPRLESV